MPLQPDPILIEAMFAARQSMLERRDGSESVGCALAVQQHSIVEGTVPGKHEGKRMRKTRCVSLSIILKHIHGRI